MAGQTRSRWTASTKIASVTISTAPRNSLPPARHTDKHPGTLTVVHRKTVFIGFGFEYGNVMARRLLDARHQAPKQLDPSRSCSRKRSAACCVSRSTDTGMRKRGSRDLPEKHPAP